MRELIVNGKRMEMVELVGLVENQEGNYEIMKLFNDDVIDIEPCWSEWHPHKANGVECLWRVKSRTIEAKFGDYIGVAKCADDDDFNFDAGIELAMVRALATARNGIASDLVEKHPVVIKGGGE